MPYLVTMGYYNWISPDYPPLKGRLYTRYAPVRHSCVSEETLPFDLHVLGLPLAFVLSQDQTLHRNFVVTDIVT